MWAMMFRRGSSIQQLSRWKNREPLTLYERPKSSSWTTARSGTRSWPTPRISDTTPKAASGLAALADRHVNAGRHVDLRIDPRPPLGQIGGATDSTCGNIEINRARNQTQTCGGRSVTILRTFRAETSSNGETTVRQITKT